MKRCDRWLRLARGAVAACLALPFLCFALWDGVLTAAAPFAPSTAEALPAAGRQNPTACLLYGCTHSLHSSLQGGTDGWTLDTAAPADRQAEDFLARVDALRQAGVLDDFRAAALRGAVAEPARFTLTRYTLQAGLEQYILCAAPAWQAASGPLPGYPRLRFQAVFTAQGVPLYLDLQGGPTGTAPPTLDQLLACAGLDTLPDWQPQQLAGYPGRSGEARYSAQTQLYARVSYEADFTYRLVSMTPAQMQAFLQEE